MNNRIITKREQFKLSCGHTSTIFTYDDFTTNIVNEEGVAVGIQEIEELPEKGSKESPPNVPKKIIGIACPTCVDFIVQKYNEGHERGA